MVFELYLKDRRLIAVKKCIAGLGEQKARALLGLHVFSGCDQVGKMATIAKARVNVTKLFIPDSVSLQCSFIHRIMILIARYLILWLLDGFCSPIS